MENWYEDSLYKHIGFVEFGVHSIYEFEVYQNTQTKEVVVMCHEEPEDQMSASDLVEFSENYIDMPEQIQNMKDVLALGGVKIA
jgi:hypothetical protein